LAKWIDDVKNKKAPEWLEKQWPLWCFFPKIKSFLGKYHLARKKIVTLQG
jgi:hypothetical protein